MLSLRIFLFFFFSFKVFHVLANCEFKTASPNSILDILVINSSCVTETSPVCLTGLFPRGETKTALACFYIYMPTFDKQMALTAVRLCVVTQLAGLHQTVNECCII